MIALLLTTLLAWQPIEAWQDTSKAAFTERVPLIYSALNGELMYSKMIKVPTRANRIAYVCFKITGKRLIQCLYIGDNGLVDQTAILPLETEL